MRHLCFLTILFFSIPISTSAQVDSNRLFSRLKGSFDYPIQKVIKVERYNQNKNCIDGDFPTKRITFYSDSSYPVKAIFDGQVLRIFEVDSSYIIITKYGSYYLTYTGLSKPVIKNGDNLKSGQIISKLYKDFDYTFSVEIYLSKNSTDIDPFPWFRKKSCP